MERIWSHIYSFCLLWLGILVYMRTSQIGFRISSRVTEMVSHPPETHILFPVVWTSDWNKWEAQPEATFSNLPMYSHQSTCDYVTNFHSYNVGGTDISLGNWHGVEANVPCLSSPFHLPCGSEGVLRP